MKVAVQSNAVLKQSQVVIDLWSEIQDDLLRKVKKGLLEEKDFELLVSSFYDSDLYQEFTEVLFDYSNDIQNEALQKKLLVLCIQMRSTLLNYSLLSDQTLINQSQKEHMMNLLKKPEDPILAKCFKILDFVDQFFADYQIKLQSGLITKEEFEKNVTSFYNHPVYLDFLDAFHAFSADPYFLGSHKKVDVLGEQVLDLMRKLEWQDLSKKCQLWPDMFSHPLRSFKKEESFQMHEKILAFFQNDRASVLKRHISNGLSASLQKEHVYHDSFLVKDAFGTEFMCYPGTAKMWEGNYTDSYAFMGVKSPYENSYFLYGDISSDGLGFFYTRKKQIDGKEDYIEFEVDQKNGALVRKNEETLVFSSFITYDDSFVSSYLTRDLLARHKSLFEASFSSMESYLKKEAPTIIRLHENEMSCSLVRKENGCYEVSDGTLKDVTHLLATVGIYFVGNEISYEMLQMFFSKKGYSYQLDRKLEQALRNGVDVPSYLSGIYEKRKAKESLNPENHPFTYKTLDELELEAMQQIPGMFGK